MVRILARYDQGGDGIITEIVVAHADGVLLIGHHDDYSPRFVALGCHSLVCAWRCLSCSPTPIGWLDVDTVAAGIKLLGRTFDAVTTDATSAW